MITRIGTWNVRTLHQSGRLKQLLKEFDRYRLDLLGVSEVRWKGNGEMTCDGKRILYSGNEDEHIRGVGLVLGKEAIRALIGWKPINDRIITARFASAHVRTTVIQVYAPTEQAGEAEKDDFYNVLQAVMDETPKHDLKLVIGDMNAQFSIERHGFEKTIGPFASSARLTDNGERLVSFCEINDLCVGNTFFQHKLIHKKTWRSPNGCTFNEIDHMCISRRWRTAMQDVRVFRAADVGSDHYLVRMNLRLKLRRHGSKPKIVQPFAIDKLKDRDIAATFALQLRNRFEALADTAEVESQWQGFKETMTACAQEVIGRRRGKRKEEWIQDRSWTLIDQRRKAKQKRDQAKNPDDVETTALAYANLDRAVKRSCRRDKKDWLEKKCREAQEAADRKDTRALYRIAKDLSGTWKTSSVPIKDKNGKLLLTKDEQDARWVEHFRETLNQPHPPTTYNFGQEEAQEELRVKDGDITAQEVQMAIKTQKPHKAAGLDEIQAELLKRGGPTVVAKLTILFNMCWQAQTVPEDWQKGVIVKLPKKGNATECTNWRGITLLSVPGKVFCAILLRRVQAAADQRLREEQAGFRQGRSCSDQIFALRNIIEQCVEYKRPLSINFIDFKKAFDSIHRESLWNILHLYGIPRKFIAAFQSLYHHSNCCIKTGTGHTEFFAIETGVRQGCILSPFLFLVALDFIMRKALTGPSAGIDWDGQSRLTDLDFADDIALLAEDGHHLQEPTSNLHREAAKVGLRISAEKSKVMHVGTQVGVPKIRVEGQDLEEVERFTYLGSVIGRDGDAETDVKCRIGKASAVFQQMRNIWSSASISLNIKLRLYASITLPMATYAAETWKASASITRKVNVFHQRCLRRILRIRYFDHITNEEVLQRSKLPSLSTIIARYRLRLAGHVFRMDDSRIPRKAFRWVPLGYRRGRGRPRLTWRRTFINDLKALDVSWDEAEDLATDRTRWRTLVAQYAL
uniref:Reverse transcriptase domain-containing protein n=1 Tax=Plectus sambesii TaxID=2011161 RepID=A0A914URD9_9BILA